MTGQDADLVRTLHEAAIAGAIPVIRLPPIPPGGAFAREWATYRREVDRLLAGGCRGRFALVHGDDVVGVYDTQEAAATAGRDRFGAEPILILEVQPVIGHVRFGYTRVCLD